MMNLCRKLGILHYSYVAPLLVLATILPSCTNSKLELYELTVVVSQDLGLEEGKPLTAALKTLANYSKGTEESCADRVLVPSITIVRADLTPARVEPFLVPLTALNGWRQSIGLLSATNLMEDYDDQIPRLTTPNILAARSGAPADTRLLKQKYPGETTLTLTLSEGDMPAIAALRDRITSRLCKESGTSFTVILNRTISHEEEPVGDDHPVATALEARNREIGRESSQSAREVLVTRTVEEYGSKVGTDFLARYAMSKTVIYGKEHHEAFELLTTAADLAIEQDKAEELLRRIAEDIEGDLRRPEKRDRTIWRLSTPDHPEWIRIVKALEQSDETLLPRSHHHEHGN